MQPWKEPVKGQTEAGRRREQRARATRDRIIGAATELFVEHGYTSTTIEAIASTAGVATATVYQAFGTKAAVLARALDETIAGHRDPQAVLDSPWVRAASDETDPRKRLEAVVHGSATIAARTSALKVVMRDAAATEPGIRELVGLDDARRLTTQRRLTAIALGRAPSEDQVALFYSLVNSHAHDLATTQLGWSRERWSSWLVEVLTAALLGDHGDA